MSNLTIADRVLVPNPKQKGGSTKGVLSTQHLEEVRDYVRKIEANQNPKDIERTLNQLHVDFTSGRMEASFVNVGGSSEVYRVTSNGAAQLAKEVLPTRFFTGLRQLATRDAQGAKLASLVWAKFAQDHDVVRMVRTVRMNLNGEIHRVIRSCHSQGYAPYSNAEFLTDILDNAQEYANLPVLSWRVTDSGMRIRFAGLDAETHAFAPLDPSILLDQPIAMIEGWNSEVGRRRVGLRGGLWKLSCTNGMGHWDERQEHNWIHRGTTERIRSGVRDAFVNLQTSASGLLQDYKDAVDIEIDDAYEWLTRETRGMLADRVVIAAKKGLSDPTTTPGGKLASVVDALTLVAQDEKDMFEQYEVERVASKLLKRGQATALRNGGRIPVAA